MVPRTAVAAKNALVGVLLIKSSKRFLVKKYTNSGQNQFKNIL